MLLAWCDSYRHSRFIQQCWICIYFYQSSVSLFGKLIFFRISCQLISYLSLDEMWISHRLGSYSIQWWMRCESTLYIKKNELTYHYSYSCLLSYFLFQLWCWCGFIEDVYADTEQVTVIKSMMGDHGLNFSGLLLWFYYMQRFLVYSINSSWIGGGRLFGIIILWGIVTC